MYLRSSDCNHLFPKNIPGHFTVKLAGEVDFSRYSHCALVDMVLPEVDRENPDAILVTSNFVVESYFGVDRLPIVQQVIMENVGSTRLSYSAANYVKVKDFVTDVVEMSVCDGGLNRIVNFITGVSYFVFHFVELEPSVATA